MPQPDLLLIEDDEAIAELIVWHFAREGFSVRQTPDGVQVDVALTAWADEEQARRCLDGLLADELVRRTGSLLRL